jgi:molybdate transport system ATP-binding protein
MLSLDLRVPLQRFDLEVRLETRARSLGVFGPSGSGKTTLLEALAGWRRAVGRAEADGRVLFDTARGVELPVHARGIGYVPQEGLLFPHQGVLANVRAGLERVRASAGEREALVARVLRVLELEPLAGQAVASLSGGERQRVALARALCSGPSLLLLDEPLGALDAELRRRILPYLVRSGEEFGVPMLYVSHDATEVSVLCEEVVLLRDGRVAAHGGPLDLLSDSWRRGLVDEAAENVLRGEVSEVRGDTARVTTGGGATIEVPGAGLARAQRVVLGIRSDEVLIAAQRPVLLSARNALPASVARLDEAGRGVVLRASLAPGGEPLDALLTRAAVAELGLAVGSPVFAIVKSSSVRVHSALPPR